MRASAVPVAHGPATGTAPSAEDGLGLAALLDLLAVDPSGEAPATSGRRPAGLVARARGWLHRAADWGAGPQRSWCAW
ncbi:hypothetical protein JOD57_002010 [Geodermatophilus bullaregiensis]|uniref:hypothetical protein n=1 Tax=Geodermatophilus bullaregiensis TaxID=1564160 RepID=UPI0019593A7F|nr:hypothetical protein [Geodermatophilus bullaregiensis]MBM7806173.1 hypothetical protein [Geodermatophilus bullaregiensis]